MDQYRVETVAHGSFAIVRFGDDGRETIYVTSDQLAAIRTRDELERAEARAFKAGLIVGHAERLDRPV